MVDLEGSMGAPLAGAAEKLKDGIPPPHTFGGSRAWRARDQRLFQRMARPPALLPRPRKRR